MKKMFLPLLACFVLAGCGGDKNEAKDAAPAVDETVAERTVTNPDGSQVTTFRPDTSRVYHKGDIDRKNLFAVISKRELRLMVYGAVGGDTVLVAHYPVCLSRNKGQKTTGGDMKTPESEPGKPFTVKQIQDASTWEHDFGDGRGMIKAYGDWFIRLETPFSGIGIHGSTNNESSVPGRDSEGCIRLRDNDIRHFKENYAYVGMPVIIKAEGQDLLPFETKAKP